MWALGWVALAAMVGGAYYLYTLSSKPTTAGARFNRLTQQAGADATDPLRNRYLPLPGAGDTRTARQVVEHWLMVRGCLPDGQSFRGAWDLDIGGWQNGQDTQETGEHGQLGGVWVPAYERLVDRIERKMIDEAQSGFPANPPNPADQSERSRRMDLRSCAWVEMRSQLGLPIDVGFGAWRQAFAHRGARSRADALRAPLGPPGVVAGIHAARKVPT